MILVTGGAGFIGSNFILDWIKTNLTEDVINLDALTYAGNLANLETIQDSPTYQLVKGNIVDKTLITRVLMDNQPRAIIHFAAESHVDRSIHGPAEFVQTNIIGTFNLLECARAYWNELSEPQKSSFRFLHVSTDEVYGSLGPNDHPFTEKHPYEPNSPYSASKAASDHLVRAWFHKLSSAGFRKIATALKSASCGTSEKGS
jgi:dTDP-glucose 4,6-dehydratase